MTKTIRISFAEATKLGAQGIKQRMVDNGMELFPMTQQTLYREEMFKITSEAVK